MCVWIWTPEVYCVYIWAYFNWRKTYWYRQYSRFHWRKSTPLALFNASRPFSFYVSLSSISHPTPEPRGPLYVKFLFCFETNCKKAYLFYFSFLEKYKISRVWNSNECLWPRLPVFSLKKMTILLLFLQLALYQRHVLWRSSWDLTGDNADLIRLLFV